MKRLQYTVIGLGILIIVACGTPAPNKLDVKPFDGSSSSSTASSDDKPTTCAVAREAFLTGTPEDIRKALEALKADTNADATAREYADNYLNRDAGNTDLQSMDKSLIQASCS